MRKKDISTVVAIISSIIAIGAIAGLITQILKRKQAEGEAKRIQDEYQKLVLTNLEKNKNIPDFIKKQFKDLFETYKGIDVNVAIELQKIINLMDNGQDEVAIEKLTKIIEDNLKEKFVKEGKAKDKKHCPVLYEMLKTAKHLNWITEHEFSVSMFLKDKARFK